MLTGISWAVGLAFFQQTGWGGGAEIGWGNWGRGKRGGDERGKGWGGGGKSENIFTIFSAFIT